MAEALVRVSPVHFIIACTAFDVKTLLKASFSMGSVAQALSFGAACCLMVEIAALAAI